MRPREAVAAVEAAEHHISAAVVVVILVAVGTLAGAGISAAALALAEVDILAARVDLRYRGPRRDQVSAVHARLRFAAGRTGPSTAGQRRG
jgi:hypothetical protein